MPETHRDKAVKVIADLLEACSGGDIAQEASMALDAAAPHLEQMVLEKSLGDLEPMFFKRFAEKLIDRLDPVELALGGSGYVQFVLDAMEKGE